jgi:hypothetical protein
MSFEIQPQEDGARDKGEQVFEITVKSQSFGKLRIIPSEAAPLVAAIVAAFPGEFQDGGLREAMEGVAASLSGGNPDNVRYPIDAYGRSAVLIRKALAKCPPKPAGELTSDIRETLDHINEGYAKCWYGDGDCAHWDTCLHYCPLHKLFEAFGFPQEKGDSKDGPVDQQPAGATCPELAAAWAKHEGSGLSATSWVEQLTDLRQAIAAQMKYAPPRDAGIPREAIAEAMEDADINASRYPQSPALYGYGFLCDNLCALLSAGNPAPEKEKKP